MNAIPWYKSRILQGILTVIVTQLIARVQSQYHVDLSVLGFSITEVVNWLMDVISAAALAWATHAHVVPQVPIPAEVTLTQSAADKANAENPTQPPPQAAAPLSPR